ncbi:DUF4335 domain-containing protein [Chamaesiphon sp. GL140_3_metabinner_50]|uniref:DUF4335 domain-containing protein n=1 Tax=Chamaesiphon sp. GL140_3_metabinner_50 TaxID=2970812 RepID=UPI0025F4B08F|nr:DUF4335 domain-containing protein [Chamaesiphon sp. GL140_3_metabinner_50]
MESNHLTTRTYTAPTCTLVVSSKEVQPARNQAQPPSPVDFILELEQSDLGEIDRVTLQGQPSQLDRLHQTVNTYIAALVAKFPHPIAQIEDRAPADPTSSEPPAEIPPQPLRDPRIDDESSPRAGILRNLPGLRDSLPPIPPAIPPNPQSGFEEKPSISRLLGRWQKPQRRESQPLSTPLNSAAGATPAGAPVPTQPYLTGVGERSLEHQLHLGNLATAASGSVLTLSAIQLFDLAAVLDEYTAEHATPNDRPNVLSRNSIYSRGERASEAIAPAIPGVPNLPGIPAQHSERPAYYPVRIPRKSSSFMSGIPWAIAAAAAVGLPLLLLDPNANPVKDLASQLKIPSLTGTKKVTTTITAKTPKDPATKTDTTVPIVGATPTPWQAQPVEPPKTTVKPTDPTKVAISDPTQVTATPDTSKIGIAAIPDAILSPGGTVPTIDGTGTATTATTATKPLATAKPTPTSKTATKPLVTATTKPAATTTIGQLPIDAETSGKVSISKQPISVPSAFPSPVATKPTTPIPFDRAGIDAAGKIDPVTRSLKPKTTATTTTPALAPAKPRPQSAKPNPAGSPNSSDPFTPVPKNPNLIDLNQNSPETKTPQPAATPTQPLQSNAGGFSGDPVENSSLQETKRYFEGKWKASTTQQNALQYVLQVNGKSGVVRAVAPQGEAATTYLQQTKFIKPGQKLLTPADGGGEQKIRVLLQPDGSVDTFIEP